MSDGKGPQPDGLHANDAIEDIVILDEPLDEGAGRQSSAARLGASLSRIESSLRPRLHAFGGAALGFCAMVFIALALAQGLTAGLLSSWPTKIAGGRDPGLSSVSLATQTVTPRVEHIPQPKGGTERLAQSQASGDSAQEFKVARIEEVAGISTPPDTVGMGSERGYLPPQDRRSGDSVVISVPVSQGRLLRFDEPVESVFIADPNIADIRVVSPQLVYVYGKNLGHTESDGDFEFAQG